MASPVRRYSTSPVLGLNEFYGTSYAITSIRDNVKNGNIRFREIVIKEGIRLDVLAGIEYGDGRLYWIIAAASDVGFATAVLPGTVIKIPNLSDVLKTT